MHNLDKKITLNWIFKKLFNINFCPSSSCAACSVFLVDHAWTYRVENARQQLEQIPGLLPRMAALMGVDFHGEAPDPDTVELVMEHMWKYNQTYHLSQGVC